MKLCIHTCVRLRALPTYHSYGTTVLLHGTTLPQFAASACTKPHYMKSELIKRKVKSQKRTLAMPKMRHTCIGSASYTYRCMCVKIGIASYVRLFQSLFVICIIYICTSCICTCTYVYAHVYMLKIHYIYIYEHLRQKI